MMKPFATAFLATVATTAAITLPTLALAGPQYSASDIEAHFAKPKAVVSDCVEGELCLPKAKTRGVCIGSASQCGNDQPDTAARPAPGGFDLLITFELGSDRLSDQAQANLSEFARAMSGPALSAATFNVDGHTDASGSDTFNKTLSQRRAASVVSFLENLGISRDRLLARGHGESKPRVSDPFAAVNRRVEATINVR